MKLYTIVYLMNLSDEFMFFILY